MSRFVFNKELTFDKFLKVLEEGEIQGYEEDMTFERQQELRALLNGDLLFPLLALHWRGIKENDKLSSFNVQQEGALLMMAEVKGILTGVSTLLNFLYQLANLEIKEDENQA